MGAWYCRDNSTVATDTNTLAKGTVGWSAVTGWAPSTVIAAGAIRRESAGNAVFTASQSTTTLSVTAVTSGTIYINMHLITGASQVTVISALGTGTGGTGNYTVANSQTVASTTWNGGLQPSRTRTFICVVAGTTGATEPNWSINSGTKTTDNTVTWMECTGQSAMNGDMTNTPKWATVTSLAVALGKVILDNAGTHIFICTTAGTTGGSEPTWNTAAVGNTTADNTATWTYVGTSFSSWAAPHAYLSNIASTPNAGDAVYLGDDHSDIQQNQTSINAAGSSSANPTPYYSIDHTLSLPVGSAGLKAGATVATQGAQVLNLLTSPASSYFYGINFIAGSAANTANILVCQSSPTWGRFDTCTFKLNNTSASSTIQFGLSGGTAFVELINSTVQFGATTQSIKMNAQSKMLWRNTPSAIAGATIPTTLFNAGSVGVLLAEGVDLSAETGTLVPNGTSGSAGIYEFIDCKLNSGVTIATAPANIGAPLVDVIRSSSNANTYIQRRYWYQGTLQEEATIIRTNGASDGTTGISWNLTTTANSKWITPFETFPIAIWNSTTGANRTLTLHGIWNAAALPNNDDIWIDVAYLGSASTPMASFATNTKTNNLDTGSPLTADSTSAWDSIATARANTTGYVVGNVISVSSNPGRIFFCTTNGTSNGSLPVGYASAIDGGSVTDGTAVFRAGVRFILPVTLSAPQPQLAGYIRTIVKVAKASSTFYVDPLVVLS